MSKKNHYDIEDDFEELDPETYYMPPMFRYPCFACDDEIDEDATRAQNKMGMMNDMSDISPSGKPLAMGGGGMGQTLGGTLEGAQPEPVLAGRDYTQGYLRSIIGRRIRVTFLIGTNIMMDRSGVLSEVGVSYLILTEPDSGVRTLCDLYSIKFVDILPGR